MNLTAALLTGKPFRRVGESTWHVPGFKKYSLSIADMLADNWEVEEVPIHITKGMLYEAHDRQPEGFGSGFTDAVWNELIGLSKGDGK